MRDVTFGLPGGTWRGKGLTSLSPDVGRESFFDDPVQGLRLELGIVGGKVVGSEVR